MSKDTRKYKGKRFINFQAESCDPETVDEFDTLKEAREAYKEYRLSYGPWGRLWISQRPIGDWYEKTRTIAGIDISLVSGRTYLASRPLADGRDVFPVTIRDNEGKAVVRIPGLDYDQSNDLINQFNNDERGSLFGRVW